MMIRFCVELADESEVIIHKDTCGSYDHGSLLGEGRIFTLGAFDKSSAALRAARRSYPHAMLCQWCCKTERTPASVQLAAP